MSRLRLPLTRRLGARLLGSWALLIGSSVFAYQLEQRVEMDPETGLVIQLRSPLGEFPGSGFYPMNVRIENPTEGALSWTLRFIEPGTLPAYSYETEVAVAAKQVREFQLLIPGGNLEAWQYGTTVCQVTGPGVRRGSYPVESGSSRGTSAYVAIAEPLGSLAWSKLNAAVNPGWTAAKVGTTAATTLLQKSRLLSSHQPRALRGSILRLEELPPDARSFAGLGGLWLRAEDWRALPNDRRQAIRQWVQEGGNLIVATAAIQDDGAKAPSLPGLPGRLRAEPTPFGLGQVRLARLSDGELLIHETAQTVADLENAPSPPWAPDFALDWPLRKTVGVPTLNVPLVIGFVCLFGILIGPFNFLVLAPPSRRHRLFFTVPLLSLGASLLLFVIISVGDGIGAVGARSALLFVPAGENRLTLRQEQLVRTKLLFSRGFQLPETVAAAYLPPAGEETAMGFRRNRQSLNLTRAGTAMAGDWFRSRSSQGLLLRGSIPSRGEVTLRPAASPTAAPELLSTLASPLRPVFYVDAAGAYWKGSALTTGRPLTLQPAQQEEFAQWSKELTSNFSSSFKGEWEQAKGRPGYFYAQAEPSAENTYPTLPSITWTQQTVACLGPCTPETAP